MNLLISGESRTLPVERVNDLLQPLELPNDGRGIAIAVNDMVIARSRWQEYMLHEGDKIEIVRAVQGG